MIILIRKILFMCFFLQSCLARARKFDGRAEFGEMLVADPFAAEFRQFRKFGGGDPEIGTMRCAFHRSIRSVARHLKNSICLIFIFFSIFFQFFPSKFFFRHNFFFIRNFFRVF